MARQIWVSVAWCPMSCIILLATCIKDGGTPPRPNVPPLGPCKNRSFQHRGPRRRRRESWMPRDRRRFGARRDAKRALSQRRTPSASPSCPSGDPARSNRRFRRVCSHPGLLKTPENARRAPGDPCVPLKTRSHPKVCERGSQMAARTPSSGTESRTCPPGHFSHRASAENLMPCADVG